MPSEEEDKDDEDCSKSVRDPSPKDGADPNPSPSSDEDEEEEEDDEPQLKYARLTGSLGAIYRNGDATSAFLVAGDKMVVGTHNGNIHVQALPSLQSVRVYHAHAASVTAVSISPFPPPLPNAKADEAALRSAAVQQSSSASKASPKSPRQRVVPATTSNSIYIATSSIDGKVCVSSLVDTKDVQLRDFGRPVQAVALSPDYKADKTYLSGGLAGNLVLTVGGRAGTRATSSTTGSTAAVASGWLGTIGLTSNTGKDTVLHSGEGPISVIKWSRSGRFVVWVNEQGIKIMRSHLHLDSEELDDAWKRISHVDRPDSTDWDEMSSVWRARAEWINEEGLEVDDEIPLDTISTGQKLLSPPGTIRSSLSPARRKLPRKEKLLVGWGGTVWIINVFFGEPGTDKQAKEKSIGRAEIATLLNIGKDCTISGLTLYTPTLLLVLAYTETTQQSESKSSAQTTPKRGVHHRKNALSPEMRIIDLDTREEISTDSLTVSRFESLSASDYHLGVLPSLRNTPSAIRQRGALEYVGGTLWTAGSYATGIFSSAGGVLAASTKSDDDSDKGQKPPSISSSLNKVAYDMEHAQIPHETAAGPGMKIYIHSPYDCVLATRRDLRDHLSWILEQRRYEEAWNLVNTRPEVVGSQSADESSTSLPSTPSRSKRNTEDASIGGSSSVEAPSAPLFTAIEKEKRRIGELWLQQLIDAGDWAKAGDVAGKVLTLSSQWEQWFWVFAEAEKFDEISPFVPTERLRPPLPSTIYEVTLGHYITFDRLRLSELLEDWPSELFDIKSVSTSLQGKLKSGEFREDTVEDGERGRDWRILMESLAKLLLADGRPREALRCQIRLKNADEAMDLIRDYHLLDAVADDIPSLITLRISSKQMREASITELQTLTEEPINLLVHEASHGVVRAETVVSQLEEADKTLFLFFYLRRLWKGVPTDALDTSASAQETMDSRLIVEEFPNLAVELFASYDRKLLEEFLKSSSKYDLEKALRICERRNYVQEQVYLLSLTGLTKKALRLIIDKLHDVSGAIAFAKQQDDPDLWNDLLDYSMDKPQFIRGLLEEVGTAIDPITLVKRIPEGLEIEGLKDGLGRMVREYEIQHSISEGVAKVFHGELAVALDELRAKQKKGIYFDINNGQVDSKGDTTVPNANSKAKNRACAGCEKRISIDERETLVGFPCGHIFHLACLLDYEDDPENVPRPLPSDEIPDYPFRSVRNKVTHAMWIKNQISGGCPIDMRD